MILCTTGLAKLPKCRYGENNCFYHPSTAICDHTGAFCATSASMASLVKVRIEGSSDNVSEQLAIPVVSTVLSFVCSILLFMGNLIKGNSQGALEAGKWFIVGTVSLSLFALWIVQSLSFNGRWWNQQTQEDMKQGWYMYCVGTVASIVSMIGLLWIAITHKEAQYVELAKHSRMS
eukprot:TRINITY_DN1169_c0_g1_i2.p1 TRINITY_DN1169_c0_g1~~TRINITY_DN1169_c0_g1_i2.p1  ORF type:complete len:176 (+),score=49.06 TRINITY_DN1169_c0_g1_i2:175-702(+)